LLECYLGMAVTNKSGELPELHHYCRTLMTCYCRPDLGYLTFECLTRNPMKWRGMFFSEDLDQTLKIQPWSASGSPSEAERRPARRASCAEPQSFLAAHPK